MIGASAGDEIEVKYTDAIDEDGNTNQPRNTLIFVTALAQNLAFADTDPDEGEIGGTLTWEAASNEANALTDYIVHYLGDEYGIIGPEIQVVHKGNPYSVTIPSGTAIPEGATKFGIFSWNANHFPEYKSAKAAVVPINDTGAPLAFIPNYGSGTISVINTYSSSVIESVYAGSGPFGVAVNPVQNKVAVSNLDSDNITIIDTNDLSTDIASAGTDPSGMCFSPDGTKLYVASQAGSVYVLDAGIYSPLGVIPVAGGALGIDITPDGSRVYVANNIANTVSVINTSNNSVIEAVYVGSNPQALAVTPEY